MSRVRILAALAAFAAAAGAQTVRPPVNGAVSRSRGAKPTTQARSSDAELEAAIRARLAKSQKISEDHFQVHVQGGVATIEGKTGVVQHKGSATRMAKAAGALAVNNRIQVSDAAKEKAAANLETGRRRAQIKRGDARSDSPSDPRQPH
ncbi:MAG: BON domain-containing protein [Bryobacteraceae bacterium]|jgi:osmotically-inducible protein OsmY